MTKPKPNNNAQNDGTVKQLVLPKKPRKSNECISEAKKSQLRDLFMMDGITPYQASQIAQVHRLTANRYFDQWANELIEEPDHESWAYRQRRVRVRALEGITRKILYVNSQRTNLKRVLDRHLFTNAKDEILKPMEQVQDNLIISYNKTIMDLTGQLMMLHDEYDAIDAQPPASIILKKEIMDLANELQRVTD